MTTLLVTCDHVAFPGSRAFAVAQILDEQGIDYSFLVSPETPFFTLTEVREAVATRLGVAPDELLVEEV